MNFDLRKTIGWAVKILVICILVGYGLSLLDIGALDVWRSVSRGIRYVVENFGEVVETAWPYAVTGAAVVIPIVLIKFGLDLLKRRRS